MAYASNLDGDSHQGSPYMENISYEAGDHDRGGYHSRGGLPQRAGGPRLYDQQQRHVAPRHHPYAGGPEYDRRGGGYHNRPHSRPLQYDEDPYVPPSPMRGRGRGRGEWRGRADMRSRGGGPGGGRGRGRGGGYYGDGDGNGEWGGQDSYHDGIAPPYNNMIGYGGGGRGYGDQGHRGGAGYNNGYERTTDFEKRPLSQHIDARVARERPCRTLFIRNVQYDLSEDEIRATFEKYGDVKNLFNLIESRGMVFITYYDIRAAEHAKEKLQGADLGGRQIDVHYSLPKEEEESHKCDRDKNQGTLFITLRDSDYPLEKEELTKYFETFGDVKIVRGYKDHENQRFIEFYDSRACVAAYDATLNKKWHNGTFDCKFAWDQSLKDRMEAIAARREKPIHDHRNLHDRRYNDRHHEPPYDRSNEYGADYPKRSRYSEDEYRGFGGDQGYIPENRYRSVSPRHGPPPLPGPASIPQPPRIAPVASQQLPTAAQGFPAPTPAVAPPLSNMSEEQRLQQAQAIQKMLQQIQASQQGQPPASSWTSTTTPAATTSQPPPAQVLLSLLAQAQQAKALSQPTTTSLPGGLVQQGQTPPQYQPYTGGPSSGGYHAP